MKNIKKDKKLKMGMKEKNNLLLFILFCVLTLSFTIGYSALNKELKISGEAVYRAKTDIRVTNIELSGMEFLGVENYKSKYSVNTVNVGVNLPELRSTVTYKIQVTNVGSRAMWIDSITKDINNSNVEYKMEGLSVKELINIGEVKDFYITIKYKSGIILPSITNADVRLKFNFDYNKCPLVMEKFVGNGGENYDINDYFFEAYHLLGHDFDNNEGIRGLFGSVNSYDRKQNIASYYGMYDLLKNIGSEDFIYATNYYPIYIALKNVSDHDLENWVIMPDFENFKETVNEPLDYFNVWWEVYDGKLSNWLPPYWHGQTDINASTNSTLQNLGSQLPFEFHDVWNNFTELYDGYPVSRFYDSPMTEFQTTPVAPGDYLILGIMFPKVSTNYTMPEAIDGVSFKIFSLDSPKFDVESAFKVRLAFDKAVTVNNFKRGLKEDFETNPSLYPYPVPWWEQ